MLRKSLLALSVSAAMFAATNASAGAIDFSRDGTGSATAVSIDKFNWQPDSLLAKNLVKTIVASLPVVGKTVTDSVNSSFNFFGQGRLDSMVSDSNTNAGSPGCSLQGSTGSKCNFAGQFTYSFGVSLDVTDNIASAASTTVKAKLGGTPATNFFNIYFNPIATAADSGTGLGYQSGIQILSAHFLNSSLAVTVDSQATSGLFKLDGFGKDDRSDFGTLNMNGSFQMDIDVDSQLTNFFVTELTNIGLAMNLTSPNAAPFNQVNPALSVVGNTPNFGVDKTSGQFKPFPTPPKVAPVEKRTMNNLSCADLNSTVGVRNCDIELQSQGTTAFFNVNTPEPGTTALLGLALSMLGVSQVRRSKKKQA